MARNQTVKLRERVSLALGLNRFSKTYFLFLKSHTLFLIFMAIPNVFINTFFMNQTDDTNVVLLYNMLNYIFTGLGMFPAVYLMRKASAAVCAIVGVSLYNVMYVCLLLLNNNAADYAYLLGIFNGIASGFYWLSYATRLAESTTDENREGALSLQSIFSSIVNLVFPMISGAIISSLPGNTGYFAIFGLALFLALITIVELCRLPKISITNKKTHICSCLKTVFHNKVWFLSMFTNTCYSVREGAFAFMFNIIIFQFVRSEALVGLNTFLCAAASIASSILLMKIVNQNNRLSSMLLSSVFMFIVSIIFIFYMNVYTCLVFAVINAAVLLYLSFPVSGVVMSPYGVMPDAAEFCPEFMAIKENFVGTGRSIGIILIMVINLFTQGNLLWQAVALACLSAFQGITVLVASKCLSAVDDVRKNRATEE